ncbi:MAG TPA: S8 family serine peptidase [Bryobacteraceae bacterium]|nr:S8 family serine peptidase [Bryobacteraceae bacterium]
MQQLRRASAALVAAAISFLLAIGIEAQVVPVQPLVPPPSAGSGVAVNETGTLWFVELNSAPVADGTPAATVRQEKANFRAAARAAGLAFSERYAFDTLWNGLSIQIDPSQISKLSRIPGVAAVYPVGVYSLPPVQTVSDPNLITALAMTGADIAQNSLGLSGAGVKVGIIDTGIDYNHPDLGGPGPFPTGRVISGWDFVGDAYDAGTNPVPVPDPDPLDCAGHGTHVAGIVGANGLVKGVAPRVSFGAYRVFGCAGSTADDIMIAAMERALSDGMQVVNMSIGASFGWPQWPTAMAGTRLVNKGVVVVASIGNDGTSGIWAASAPGLGSKVIGVASFDNTHLNLASFTVSPNNAPIGYISATGAPAAPLAGTFPLARTGTTTTAADACNLPLSGVSGKIALIRRGTCSFYIKAFNAMSAGAIGVVLYNNAAGIISPTVAGAPPIAIPVVSISAADGATLNALIAGGTTTLTWTSDAVSLPNATGGLISSFSSYGLSPDLVVKPDIGAPGGYIRSTYPLALGSYANLSGTSMSSPHVAGAAALLLQASPHTPSQAVRDILQNGAEPALWWGNPALGFLDNVHRQGAGMLHIDKSILNTTRVSPGKLSLGDNPAGLPVTQNLTISNQGGTAVTYQLAAAPALSTGPNPFVPGFTTGFATVTFSASSVTVRAGSSATVGVTITANPGLPDDSLFGGYIVVSPGNGGEAISVPYAGLKGNYQSIQVLAPTPYGFPWLAQLSGGSFHNQQNGATFTMTGGDIPHFLVHFDHQARWMKLEVFDANTGRDWHFAGQEPYLPRNSSSTGFFDFPWDGGTVNGNKVNVVPNGTYIVKLTVLKALGDDSNPADLESWTSPSITIARP